MKWNRLKKAESEIRFKQFCKDKEPNFETEETELRNDICKLFNETLKIIGISADMINQRNNPYKVDSRFGLKFYELLNNKYGFTERDATDEGIWRYLSVNLVPDIVAMRYSIDHEDRYWKKPKRIWLRAIWWYIHLSWQGNADKTYRMICDNSTDEIAQLVDRCGHTGYRIPLYRELIAKYGTISKNDREKGIFRRVMVLNTARVQIIEPGFVPGGERKYVEDLFSYVKKA